VSSKIDALWVIPCLFDPDRPVVFECIRAIQRYHTDPKILIVDSGSPDRSYLEFCIRLGCKTAPINNKLYSFGAHAWAIRHYGEVPYFFLIMDSLIVQSNCDHLREQPVTTLRHWPNSMHGWGWDSNGVPLEEWGGEQLDRMGVPMPSEYVGTMGPVLFAQREVIDKLDFELGYWFCQTDDKYKLCAMERVQGIVLAHLGYDPSNSLQGIHTRHEADYPEGVVRKINMARM